MMEIHVGRGGAASVYRAFSAEELRHRDLVAGATGMGRINVYRDEAKSMIRHVFLGLSLPDTQRFWDLPGETFGVPR